MCLCNWDGMFFNNSCLCHLWLKIIPSRLLRHFRATTREGNLYHHSCYARNVPYLVPNYIFPQFRFQNFYHGWVASLVQQNLGFLQKQLQVIVEELPIRSLELKTKYFRNFKRLILNHCAVSVLYCLYLMEMKYYIFQNKHNHGPCQHHNKYSARPIFSGF